jgi:cyclic pyranopterin phosphate synthase
VTSFSHLDSSNQPAMVDIGGKAATRRMARAEARVWLPAEVLAHFDGSDIRGPKGAVFQTAVIAGIMAAKKTDELIPLCHSLPLDDCKITIAMEETGENGGGQDLKSEPAGGHARVECTVKTDHRTGVEMEALTGASVAALTLYDMCKALSHDIVITQVRLMEKTGGKKDFRRDGESA